MDSWEDCLLERNVIDVVTNDVIDISKAIGQQHIPRWRISVKCLQQLQQ